MDYKKILKSKIHNEHYLNRYITLMEFYRTQTLYDGYSEIHHICPKANDMFPEFKNLKEHPWNSIRLPFRAHVVAHYLLMKSYNNESQTLAVIRTNGQYHNKNLYKSKIIEIAKINLSNLRKGKFTRGYDENGNPNVSDVTRIKISQAKKEYYKNPENRIKQSIACKGTSGRNSEKYSIAAKNRSKEHLQKISSSVKKYYDSLSPHEKKRIKIGIYITPVGKFTSLPNQYGSYCRNNKKVFTTHNIKSNILLNTSVIGKTPAELGFDFIPKDDPAIAQHYDDLNLAHQPEPSHPLSLELNDFLLREKLLP
jgi:hypothetical protein